MNELKIQSGRSILLNWFIKQKIIPSNWVHPYKFGPMTKDEPSVGSWKVFWENFAQKLFSFQRSLDAENKNHSSTVMSLNSLYAIRYGQHLIKHNSMYILSNHVGYIRVRIPSRYQFSGIGICMWDEINNDGGGIVMGALRYCWLNSKSRFKSVSDWSLSRVSLKTKLRSPPTE